MFRVGRRFESTFILIPMLAVRELSHWSSAFLATTFYEARCSVDEHGRSAGW